MNIFNKLLVTATTTFLLVGTSYAGGVENCVAAKKATWLNMQKGSPVSKTGRVKAGSCKTKVWGCTNNWRKRVVTIQAKKGYQLLPHTVSVSKAFGANPKKNNYVKVVSKKKAKVGNEVVQEYLKSVSIEVACHRRGTPFKAGCATSGSVSAQQIPLLTTKNLFGIIGKCLK